MSDISDQALREIATHLRSIDESLKTIAQSTRSTKWTNYPEEPKSDATTGAAGSTRPPQPNGFVGPYGSGPEPYS